MLTTNEIRRKFITFFQSKGHETIRSSSLVPKDDPSLLFTNAGMVQFKKIFQGLEQSSYKRAATVQKCLRVGGKHNDLENVGRTARHHTFFEMLGNFSFGDYFKEEAIKYAWEFITKELHLTPERLSVTVFEDDDEAIELWLKNSTVPRERIKRLGEKDNFWSMGDTGPCGPCSEIYFDQGEQMSCGSNCGIGQCDCDRFLEIWNLVFMQFNQLEPGKRELLPNPSIDTGMGVERISAVCQGVYSNYDTDLFINYINYAASLAGVSYSRSMPDTNSVDTALRVIADHSRAIAFMIADGIMPSNEGRGYVLRRLLRRAYRFGRLLGMPSTFLHLTTVKVVEHMQEDFPELAQSKDFMQRLVKEEEERFEKTLDKGLILLEEEVNLLKKTGKNILSGEVAFKLYDTFGFPLDIVNDVIEKQNITIDEDVFNKLMQKQKQRAKAAWKGSGDSDPAAKFTSLLEEGLKSEFVGYTALIAPSRITALLAVDGTRVVELKTDDEGWLSTRQTPFYGESGGQGGDIGFITTEAGKAEILDSIKAATYLTMHKIKVLTGSIFLDAEAELYVNSEVRLDTARNHTCTHLLHTTLREVLGKHVHQAGSLVTSERLRFDFTHISAMQPAEIAMVEQLVNKIILQNIKIQTQEGSYSDAVAEGIIALFGEKYEDTVRSIHVGNISAELCGGTHLERTGQAGFFTILSESGVAAGTRRIEAATGWNALKLQQQNFAEIKGLAQILKGKPGELVEKVEGIQAEIRELRKKLQQASSASSSEQGKDLLQQAQIVNGITLLMVRTTLSDMKALRELSDDLRSKISSGIFCITAEESDKMSMILGVSKNLLNKTKAPDLIRQITDKIDGSGGGRDDMAQAGGNNPAGIEAAFATLKELVNKL